MERGLWRIARTWRFCRSNRSARIAAARSRRSGIAGVADHAAASFDWLPDQPARDWLLLVAVPSRVRRLERANLGVLGMVPARLPTSPRGPEVSQLLPARLGHAVGKRRANAIPLFDAAHDALAHAVAAAHLARLPAETPG